MSDSEIETSGSDPINRAHLAEITGGDEEFAQELLEEYLKSTTELMEELGGLLESPDFEKLRSLGHAIKGSSLSIGADAVSEAARIIEENSRNGSTEGLASNFAVIEETIATLRSMHP